MESFVASLLKEKLHRPTEGLTITKLHGDASYRTYYRLRFKDGHSMILMQLPPGKSSVSEEVTNLQEVPLELPFVAIDHYLKRLGLPVPEIYYYAKKERLLFLEDFGDITFEKQIMNLPLEEKEVWYQKAIGLLVTFQTKGEKTQEDNLAHRRSFDATLLNWEFDHFFEYGIETRLAKKIPESQLSTLRHYANTITTDLIKMPQTLVHRDFQSRNLMVSQGGLKLLDFQDALMGPLPYDLVALLRDSYIALPSDLLLRLTQHYHNIRSQEINLNFESFQKMFDKMTIQRKLKDAGRFVYIDRVKGNSSFLKHIPNSLSYVHEAFKRQTELKDFFELLKKYVPEF